MDNPQQTLLHLTSRGATVRTQEPGSIGKFTNMSTQPINNINKYGLLHYSIPKTMDLLDHENRTFQIRVVFTGSKENHSEEVDILIPVTLPELDYYHMTLDMPDEADDDNVQDCVAFTEILQTSINWAIQKYWTANKLRFGQGMAGSYVHTRGQVVCNRLGCVVKVTPMGRLQFIFGWRGTPNVTNRRYYQEYDNDDEKARIQENTGCPIQNAAEPTEWDMGFRGVDNQGNTVYDFVDTAGFPTRQLPPGRTIQEAFIESQIKRVEFVNMSSRVQLMFGANAASLSENKHLEHTFTNMLTGLSTTTFARTAERGRMVLVNYLSPYNPGGEENRLNLIDFTMPIQPNVYAPSFMFLQLTAQGTKSKVLGHAAERGGWAVPTASNQFKSKYDNFPQYERSENDVDPYHELQVRQCPALLNLSLDARRANPGLGTKLTLTANEHFAFDALPFDPLGNVVQFVDDAANMVIIQEYNNFSLKPEQAFLVADENNIDTNHRFGSRLTHFGDLASQMALKEKSPRSTRQFGLNQVVEAPTFTVSMIDPNWLYTDVPNSTVQSLSILLMWGDTNKNVTDVAGYPVQFTMIASQ